MTNPGKRAANDPALREPTSRCQLQAPWNRYDAAALMELLDKHAFSAGGEIGALCHARGAAGTCGPPDAAQARLDDSTRSSLRP